MYCIFSGFYNDTGEYWRSSYESPTFQQDLEHLLDQLKPLYEQLHTYVRRKLQKKYGKDKFPASGHIPAHLLGKYSKQKIGHKFDVLIVYSIPLSLFKPPPSLIAIKFSMFIY